MKINPLIVFFSRNMFDATDHMFQVSAQYEPDKESTWKYPAQKDGWVHSHNALRSELSIIREALVAMEQRTNPLEEWEILSLQRIMMAHFAHIHSHHRNEDNLFIPELRKRIQYPEKLVADHVGLENKSDELESIIKNMKSGIQFDSTNLLPQWIEYQEMMLPYLQEEEEIGLPLMRAYFTAREMNPIVQKMVANSPKIFLGSFIYSMGIERFRNEFMKQESIPNFVWYIDFNFKYKYFVNEFLHHVDSLKSGNQPISHQAWWRFF
jgi:Hemerythrin HHE cation binding domain